MSPERLRACLNRLKPHVDETRIALTGSVAICVHASGQRGDLTRAIAAEDVDFVAEDVDVVRETVTSDFLVSHFHLPQATCPKFLVQLVDPESRLRVDFFPDSLRASIHARVVEMTGIPIRALAARDILEHKLRLLAGASEAAPVDAKHYADAKRLGAVCGRDVPTAAASHLVDTTYSRNLGEACLRCQASRNARFPVAPKRAIFDVLGYV